MSIPVPEGHLLYRCLVRGENFPGEMLSLPYDVGFYTTRFVAASDAGAAPAPASPSSRWTNERCAFARRYLPVILRSSRLRLPFSRRHASHPAVQLLPGVMSWSEYHMEVGRHEGELSPGSQGARIDR
jgi:hypothetical protein